MTTSAETPSGFADGASAAGRQGCRDLSSSNLRSQDVGRGLGTAVGSGHVATDGCLPPLPIRSPHTHWPPASAGASRPRTRVIRAASGADPERAWAVIVLDGDRDAIEAITGFSSLDAADAFATLDASMSVK